MMLVAEHNNVVREFFWAMNVLRAAETDFAFEATAHNLSTPAMCTSRCFSSLHTDTYSPPLTLLLGRPRGPQTMSQKQSSTETKTATRRISTLTTTATNHCIINAFSSSSDHGWMDGVC
uniref:Uncharacterized protein n=1 Tax=Percolomonas cosmopolitus TaxID=63605 RepID=A0A7S1KSU2_9EUKA